MSLSVITFGVHRFKAYTYSNEYIEAFVVRNLGGRIKGSLSNLLFVEHVSQEQAIKDVVIIHHTGEPLIQPIFLSTPQRTELKFRLWLDARYR